MTTPAQPLTEAPQHIQLAVDLIYLLESNEIAPEVALEAIKVVERDLLQKMAQQSETISIQPKC
jgi:hypothetical protein